MVIDSHQHFWKYNSHDFPWISDDLSFLKKDFLPDDLFPVLSKNQVNGCIAVQARQSIEETEWLLQLASQHSFIKGVVGWVDLCSKNVEDQLSKFTRGNGLVGVRHVLHDEIDDDFMLRDDFQQGIKHLEQFGLTYDILIFPKHLPQVMQLVKMFPKQKFVIDHAAKPDIKSGNYQSWKNDLEGFRSLPNVFCKLSGLVTEADWKAIDQTNFDPVLDTLFDVFGDKRVMYGSDWPVCQLAASYKQVMDILQNYLINHKELNYERIMGGNCSMFYGLG